MILLSDKDHYSGIEGLEEPVKWLLCSHISYIFLTGIKDLYKSESLSCMLMEKTYSHIMIL